MKYIRINLIVREDNADVYANLAAINPRDRAAFCRLLLARSLADHKNDLLTRNASGQFANNHKTDTTEEITRHKLTSSLRQLVDNNDSSGVQINRIA